MEQQTEVREKSKDDAYTQKVYKLLEGMKPDDKLIIEKITKTETRERFIEIVKQYMREHEWMDGLSFGKAFTELKKQDLSFILQNSKAKNVTM